MEELLYRHLYRVDPAWLGNFNVASVTGYFDTEDNLASNSLTAEADFATVLFKCIEAQARGLAHGIPDGAYGLLRCLEEAIEEIKNHESASDGRQISPKRRTFKTTLWFLRNALAWTFAFYTIIITVSSQSSVTTENLNFPPQVSGIIQPRMQDSTAAISSCSGSDSHKVCCSIHRRR
jgi:hypothetical protein